MATKPLGHLLPPVFSDQGFLSPDNTGQTPLLYYALAANEGIFYQNDKPIQARLRYSRAFLDIDGDENVLALTDGLILIRYLFGFTGYQLTAGAISR